MSVYNFGADAAFLGELGIVQQKTKVFEDNQPPARRPVDLSPYTTTAPVAGRPPAGCPPAGPPACHPTYYVYSLVFSSVLSFFDVVVRYARVREAVQNGTLEVIYVPTNQQYADTFTKVVSTPNFVNNLPFFIRPIDNGYQKKPTGL